MAKYRGLWNAHFPEIYLNVDKAHFYNDIRRIQMNQHEFEQIGERYSSGYHFKLEIANGIVQNDISGTIVARDLFDVLEQDLQQKAWLLKKRITIRLTKSYLLEIQCAPIK